MYPSSPRLLAGFDDAVAALAAFRAVHIAVVREFVLKQQPTAATGSDTSGGKGTGGTAIMEFLVPLRQETQAAALAQDAAEEQGH